VQRGLFEFSSISQFDLIYYDAFAPHAQPELWTQKAMEKVSSMANNGCHLVTYCAQSQFKRNLKACGWEVERLPGPPGKREMTRATFKG
jgi:tRNA U34 5-methylaminomethyl-2-thiouridine-forming methyltransferase MnmC